MFKTSEIIKNFKQIQMNRGNHAQNGQNGQKRYWLHAGSHMKMINGSIFKMLSCNLRKNRKTFLVIVRNLKLSLLVKNSVERNSMLQLLL